MFWPTQPEWDKTVGLFGWWINPQKIELSIYETDIVSSLPPTHQCFAQAVKRSDLHSSNTQTSRKFKLKQTCHVVLSFIISSTSSRSQAVLTMSSLSIGNAHLPALLKATYPPAYCLTPCHLDSVVIQDVLSGKCLYSCQICPF